MLEANATIFKLSGDLKLSLPFYKVHTAKACSLKKQRVEQKTAAVGRSIELPWNTLQASHSCRSW